MKKKIKKEIEDYLQWKSLDYSDIYNIKTGIRLILKVMLENEK